MAISKILKKAKPKTKPKVKPKPKPKKRLTPMMKKLEVQRIKSDKFSEADAKRLLKYDDDLRDVLFKEAFRDLKATGGRVDPKRKTKPKRKFEPKPRPAKPASPPKARPLPRPKKRLSPDFSMPLPRPKKREDFFMPLPRPKPDRMVLPPRPRKKPKPKLPEGTKKLSPEKKRKVLQLLKGTPNTARKKKLLDRIRKM